MKEHKTQFEKVSDDLISRVKEFEQKNSAQIEHSWDEIEQKMPRSRKSLRHKYLYIVSVAACLAIILSVSYFAVYYREDPDLLSLALLEKEIPAETKDIILTAKNAQIRIEDESEITYETDGNITVNDKTLETASPSSAKTLKDPEELHEIYVPRGRRARTTFSDGTVMYINSGTRVIYPAVFAKNKREIIVEGEVYLDVQPDDASPFIVKTNGFDVRVLGTRFNVNSYKEESTATVTLVSGKVEIKTPGHANSILTPNQLFEKTGGSVNIKEVDVYEYICWIENIMLLGTRNAGQVFENMMRYYGKTIIYDKAIADIPLSGKLDLREDLGDALTIICSSLYLDLSRDENDNYIITLK